MVPFSNHPYSEALSRIPPPAVEVCRGTVVIQILYAVTALQSGLQHQYSRSVLAADELQGSTTSRLMEALLCFSCQPLSALLRRSWVSHSRHPCRQGGTTPIPTMGRSHWQLHCAHKAPDMAGALGHKCILTPSLPNSSDLALLPQSSHLLCSMAFCIPPNYPMPPSM